MARDKTKTLGAFFRALHLAAMFPENDIVYWSNAAQRYEVMNMAKTTKEVTGNSIGAIQSLNKSK